MLSLFLYRFFFFLVNKGKPFLFLYEFEVRCVHATEERLLSDGVFWACRRLRGPRLLGASEGGGCFPVAMNLWNGKDLSVTLFHKDHYKICMCVSHLYTYTCIYILHMHQGLYMHLEIYR
ncbi:hypothetical protein RHGRI_014122 [Rhododendron griersonianum]|uniref:Secreted protein n=1 Tax=Rhododendron griersonianum TaxID=479676 RepID=A0AAV6K8D4_9ERIC|nr:hypothetical protein RHGRI_014122 [Rhododendron griersonianum]